MIRMSHFLLVLSLFLASHTFAQTMDSLKVKIEQILLTKNAVVGVSISGNNRKDTLFLNGDRHFPMQSVFKFHIALVVLSEIDKGKLKLDQKINITKKDLLTDTWSPIRDKYPDGAVLTLSQILGYTVSQSDNIGCDILLRIIGGPETVENYFRNHHFNDISIKVNEEEMQKEWAVQFQNWTTPKSSNEVLIAFFGNEDNLLSKTSYDFLWNIMRETSTGKNRLKGELPANTIVAHKTGSSGVNQEGITAVVNDIGVVFLPGSQHFFISVLVTNSREDADTNEKIIADIAKLAWDYFVSNTK